MNEASILEQLQDIFRDVFEDEEIVLTEETTAADIEGWDSLMQITLTMEAEQIFHIKFTTDEIVRMKNVGDFVSAIAGKVS